MFEVLKIKTSSVLEHLQPTPEDIAHENAKRDAYSALYSSHRKATAPIARAEIRFSKQARLRFRNALDNFAFQFEALRKLDKQSLYYTDKDKYRERRPVFLTLTVPKQNVDDKAIKRAFTTAIMPNLIRTYNVVNYVWKAESQERGTIHFHIVIDTYIDHWKLRKLWFDALVRLKCNGAYTNHNMLSRLVHTSEVKDLASMADVLGAYFEGERDEEGSLIHKHDKSKRVRDIEGRAWGCSDSLRYKPCTIYDFDPASQFVYRQKALNTRIIEGSTGRQVAAWYQTKRPIFNKYGKFRFHIEAKHPLYEAGILYHYCHGLNTYGLIHRCDILEEAIKARPLFQFLNPPPLWEFLISEIQLS